MRRAILLALSTLGAAGLAAALNHSPAASPAAAKKAPSASPQGTEVVTVRPPADVANRQGVRQFMGISGATAGARGLSMNLVVIPPGGAAKPHTHRGFESAIYILKGRAETRYGPGLQKSVINQAGDFLFIPPDLPHQPRNLSTTEPVLAIVARNDPNEQESVVHYGGETPSPARP